ncbi:rhodanese-like domain-containing protein [Pseudomonadota bacterium]|jgi:rhodanese-related sulfurtransferase|nr:rhodanese-like domain-containing protein [Pseudomonadota bacterium]
MKSLKQLIDLAHETVPKITCEEFTSTQEQFLIIDVREGNETLATGMIDSARNIPRGLIEMRLSPNKDNLHADTPIVVYCGGGSRASLAGKTLKDIGFTNVQNLEGGFRGWKEFSG